MEPIIKKLTASGLQESLFGSNNAFHWSTEPTKKCGSVVTGTIKGGCSCTVVSAT